MVRRVGFGDSDAPPPEAEPAEAGSAALEPAGAEPAKKGGPLARAAVAVFLLLWLAGCSYGIWFAFSAIAELWAGAGRDGFDLVMIAFFGVWLVVALVAWAFGVVILMVMLFGKPITPERRAEKLRRREERRRRRSG